MCISDSVGLNGINNKADGKTIQLLLNLNAYRIPDYIKLIPDGDIGPKSIHAIEQFQRHVVKLRTPDSIIDPNGKSLNTLRQGILLPLNKDIFSGIMIYADDSLIDTYYPFFVSKLPEHDIDTPLRQAHFLAQLAHESDCLRYAEEIASGDAYEGRIDLGNTHAGDGVKFKGRGLIQLTGRSNYEQYGKSINIDLTTNNNYKKPAEPEYAVDVSCWFWETRKLNSIADQDDLLKITKRINGGTNGLDDRARYLERAKFFLLKQ